jgi:putative oxidoreductase
MNRLTYAATGRVLLGLYFLVPGLAKIADWDRHVELMQHHNIVFIDPLLAIATIANLAAGMLLLFNREVRFAALGAVVYIILVNAMLHDFWNFDGMEGAHELQNFVKNLAVLAGLLVLASTAPKSRLPIIHKL